VERATIETGVCGCGGQSPTEMVVRQHNERTFPPERAALTCHEIALSLLLCHFLGCQTRNVLWVAKWCHFIQQLVVISTPNPSWEVQITKEKGL